MKIFIPSYKRGDLITTHKIFKNFIDDVVLVIHEFDVENYSHIDVDKIILPNDMKGIGKVRNAILNIARENNISKYGMIDDDIITVGKRNENKYKNFEGRKTSTTGYDKIEVNDEFINNVNLLLDEFAIYSIPLSGFARLRNLSKNQNNLLVNTLMPFTFVFINLDKINSNIQYDENLNLYEDQDFALNVVKSGESVVSDFNYCFNASHKVKGGCFENWNKYSKEEIYQMLVNKHGVEYVKKYTNSRYNNLVFKPLKNK